MLPLRDENPAGSTPVVTWLVVAACVAAFFFWQPSPLSSTTEDVEFTLRQAAIPCEVVVGAPLTVDEVVATFQFGDESACGAGSDASPPFDAGKDVWLSVVVSMFLHGGVMHLAGNMLFLWVFGNNIEDRLGKVGFALFYVAGGVVATAAHVAVDPASTVPLVGASGAIAAVMGAYLVWFPNAPVRTVVIFLLITIIDVRAKWLLGFWFVLQFFTNPNDGVAWAAHVGGFAFGVVVALALRGIGRRSRPDRVRGAGVAGRYPPAPQPPWSDGRS
jgi:membrane associated rhomboid family serine protease